MRPESKWLPLFLSALVIPGAGQWHLGQRLKGGLMMGLTLVLVTGAIARYLSMVFALANIQGTRRPPQLNPFPVLAEAWRMDHRILTLLLLGLAAIWILSIVDLLLSPPKRSYP
ncbi:MAG TPA: hypothetical protein VJR29_13715 [bacterium]|nr:hypothetical protein [bacterium]